MNLSGERPKIIENKDSQSLSDKDLTKKELIPDKYKTLGYITINVPNDDYEKLCECAHKVGKSVNIKIGLINYEGLTSIGRWMKVLPKKKAKETEEKVLEQVCKNDAEKENWNEIYNLICRNSTCSNYQDIILKVYKIVNAKLPKKSKIGFSEMLMKKFDLSPPIPTKEMVSGLNISIIKYFSEVIPKLNKHYSNFRVMRKQYIKNPGTVRSSHTIGYRETKDLLSSCKSTLSNIEKCISKIYPQISKIDKKKAYEIEDIKNNLPLYNNKIDSILINSKEYDELQRNMPLGTSFANQTQVIRSELGKSKYWINSFIASLKDSKISYNTRKSKFEHLKKDIESSILKINNTLNDYESSLKEFPFDYAFSDTQSINISINIRQALELINQNSDKINKEINKSQKCITQTNNELLNPKINWDTVYDNIFRASFILGILKGLLFI